MMKQPWWFNPNDGYSIKDVQDWQDCCIEWKGYTVIGDRHLPNGKRQHLVVGSVKPGTIIGNAHVIGKDD